MKVDKVKKTVWQREYDQMNFREKRGFAVRKVVMAAFDRVEYQISVSPKRKSWYTGFWSWQDAANFARG